MGDGKENIDAAAQSASALAGILTTVDTNIAKLIEKVSNLGTNTKTTFTDMSDQAATLDTVLDELPQSLQTFESQMDDTHDKIKQMVDGAIDQFTRIGKFFIGANMFEPFAKDAKNQFETIGESVGMVTGLLGKLGVPRTAINLVDTLSKTAEGGQKAEAGFYGMLAASGQLDVAFDRTGTQLRDLNAMTGDFENRMAAIATATNFSTKEVIQFASELGKIPGVMDGTVIASQDGKVELDATTAALRIMSATAQSSADIIAEFTKAQETLGNATGEVSDASQKAANFISAMSQISRGANLNFKDARSFLEGVAEQFKYVGDNTDAAARVMDSFSAALRGTGLTAKSSADIVAQMVKSVSDLNLGTKAFISLRSGGPGGLQGAFQFEELLRQGKVDEIMAKMQRAFRQVAGPRIYSLEEASASPQAASQFARQRMLLQSGTFGIGKGASDEQATRILEALKSGNVNILSDTIKTGQAAIQDATEKGAQIQERNNLTMNQMSRLMERTAIAGELTAAAEVRRAFGTDVNSKLAEQIRTQMQTATVEADRQAAGRTELTPQTAGQEMDRLTAHANDLKQTGKDFITGTKQLVQDLKPGQRPATATAPGASRPQPAPPIPGPTIPMRPGPRPDVQRVLTAGATDRGAEQNRAIRTARESTEEARRQQQQEQPQNVRLNIKVEAPPGFGVNATSPDRDVDVITERNARDLNGGVHLKH